jgi:PHS family inorganic phosphate transporter-like MFS transporter
MGIALVPAFATLWSRLTMPEGRKYVESKELNTPASPASLRTGMAAGPTAPDIPGTTTYQHPAGSQKLSELPTVPLNIRDLEKLADSTSRKAQLNAFFVYFSEWRHLKTLIGTASCWFLLDVAFYGTNLNQSVLLTDIGYATGKTKFDVLMRNALGNLIIAVSGYVPGYFFTIFLVEKLGRRWIQIQGFLVCALMFAILAGGYTKLSTGGKFACFAIAQVGPSTPSRTILQLLDILTSPVLLQLRPQRYILHHPRRSLPLPRQRLRPRFLRCSREIRRHLICAPLQLPFRTQSHWSGECALDFFCL